MIDCSTEISNFQATQVLLPPDERKVMRERRDTNRKRLRAGLNKAEKPAPIGLHSQGSYAMHTMVQDAETDYDIDDGVYFSADKLVGSGGGEQTALSVRQMVCDALQDDTFKRSPEVLKNCVRIFYNAGYHVDVPAYRRTETIDHWTGKSVYVYELASSTWKQSDPRSVTEWFKTMSTDLSPDSKVGDGQLRRVVRLLKMFAKSRSSWKSSNASGFMITKLVIDNYYPSVGQDDVSLRETMKAIQQRLVVNQIIHHPVLDMDITKENDPRPGFFRDRLEENLVHLEVLDKADCSHTEAMKAWDKVFNCKWFDGQPETKAKKSEPSKAVVKEGGGRYAGTRDKN